MSRPTSACMVQDDIVWIPDVITSDVPDIRPFYILVAARCRKWLPDIRPDTGHAKGKLFSTLICSWFEPIWADKQAIIFSNSVSISPRYSIVQVKNLSHWSQNFRLSNFPHFTLKIYSPMMDVFTHKRILPDCSFKSNQRPVFGYLVFILTLCILYSVPYSLTPRSLTMWWYG